MIDDSTGKIIRNFQPEEQLTVRIRETGHPEQRNFLAFSKDFENWSDAVTFQPPQTEADLPGFILKENIVFSALPLSRELDPFLKGLAAIKNPVLFPEVRQMLDRIDLPCSLTLYIALQCPHCPGMVETLIPMAAYCPKINLHIIDGSLFPEKANEDKIMAAPTLILDGEFRWTGAVAPEEILSMILDRDPSALSTGTLKNILEAGDADWITHEMIASQSIFDGFLGLLLHETWSVRLGAMVVVEAIAEQAPALAGQLAPQLMAAFEKKDIPVQGDILYALGEVGDENTAAWISQAVGDDAHDDLKDAAKDALAAIAERRQS